MAVFCSSAQSYSGPLAKEVPILSYSSSFELVLYLGTHWQEEQVEEDNQKTPLAAHPLLYPAEKGKTRRRSFRVSAHLVTLSP